MLDREGRLREVRPLEDDLRRAGIQVDSYWDLLDEEELGDLAVPVLLKHVGLPYCDINLEGIARALARKSAFVGWDTLLKVFEETDDSTHGGAKQGLAIALFACSGDKKLNELMSLMMDPRHGQSRWVLMIHVKKYYRRPEVREFLERFSENPDIPEETEQHLKKWLAERPARVRSS